MIERRGFETGDTEEISIYDLAALVKQMTKSASDIVLVPYEEAYGAGFEDMPRRVPDITKIQRLIGHRPGLDLPEMPERVIAYERERRVGAKGIVTTCGKDLGLARLARGGLEVDYLNIANLSVLASAIKRGSLWPLEPARSHPSSRRK